MGKKGNKNNKSKFIRNIDKVYQLRAKLGKVVTKKAYQYFTKCEMKIMVEKGYIVECKHNILDCKNNIVAKNVPCFEFTQKLENEAVKNGYVLNYNSGSVSHDVSLSYNVTSFAKENGYVIGQYMSESELEKSYSGYSRPDGAFSTFDKGVICVEQTSRHYTNPMKKSKENYCEEFGYSIIFFN